jgi:hypothetical protein
MFTRILGGAIPLALALLACDEATSAPAAPAELAQEPSEEEEPEPSEPPEVGWAAGPGVFFRKHGASRYRFVAWKSEESVNRVFAAMRQWGGGEVHFAPGTYTLELGFEAFRVPNLTVSGSPGVVLQFAHGPVEPPRTLRPVEEGDTNIVVDRADGLRAGRPYQLYSPKRSGARVLDFEIESIEGDTLHLRRPVAFMPMVSEIPAGSQVLLELNAFRFRECPGLVIENLTIDGRGRGPVRGHTLYCGVYATGRYRAGERPTTRGMTVRGCTFKNLMGRGVCAYGIADVVVEDSTFLDIHAQAIEIDHYSSGYVARNHVRGAEVGVMLNDAFESVVEGNVLSGCRKEAVKVLRIFPEDWVNTGNVVRDNRIGPDNRSGVVIGSDIDVPITGNSVLGNHFVGLEPELRVVAPEGNEVER